MEITYTFNSEFTPVKLNPQQTQLVSALKDLDTVKKEEILAALEGNLVTRQDPWLIFKYYQPGFIKSGFVILDKKNKEKLAKGVKLGTKVIVVENLGGDPMDSIANGEITEDEEEESESLVELEAAGF